MKVDLSTFDKHNLWLNEAGEMQVRPGWRYFKQYSNLGDIKGAVSVENPNTGEPAFYFLKNGNVASNYHGWMQVYIGHAGATNNHDQAVLFAPVPNETTLTYADVDGELVLAAPGMPTLWGYTGGFVGIAEKTQSPAQADAGITALDIPQGLCVAWADRCVIASGRTIYISEAFYPRAYGADNVLAVDGRVYSLHVSPNGALIICTNKGVWSFSADAAATGTVVGFLEKVSDFSVNRYNQTCLTRNGLFGISEKGVTRIDTGIQEEIILSDKRLTRALDIRVSSTDYRQHASIFPTERGFVVSYERPRPGFQAADESGAYGAVCMVDLVTGFRSWWYGDNDNSNATYMNLVGVLRGEFGEDFFVGGTGGVTVVSSVYGNFDDTDDQAPNGGADNITGSLIGHIPSHTEESPVVREVTFSSDSEGDMRCAVNGVGGTQAGEAVAPVIGTDTWGSVPYKARMLKSRRFDFATRTDDVVVEVAVNHQKSRIARDLHLKITGFDKKRP